MPIIKSAKKKMKQDKIKTVRNKLHIKQYKKIMKQAIKNKNKQDLKKKISLVYSEIDKTAKRGSIHKNKAARLKSKIAKLLNKS